MTVNILINQEANEVPGAANEVGDEDSNDVQPQNLVDIQHHILGHDLLVSLGINHVLDHLTELGDAEQLKQSWKSTQTEELGGLTSSREQEVEREDSHEINEEPAMEYILLGDEFEINHFLLGVGVDVGPDEIEKEIKHEDAVDQAVEVVNEAFVLRL
jgi:hypothetical protein